MPFQVSTLVIANHDGRPGDDRLRIEFKDGDFIILDYQPVEVDEAPYPYNMRILRKYWLPEVKLRERKFRLEQGDLLRRRVEIRAYLRDEPQEGDSHFYVALWVVGSNAFKHFQIERTITHLSIGKKRSK